MKSCQFWQSIHLTLLWPIWSQLHQSMSLWWISVSLLWSKRYLLSEVLRRLQWSRNLSTCSSV
jgi:hypothetical protein